MKRGLLILGAMGLVAMGAMLWMSHSLVTKVSGVEEARALQETLRAGAGTQCEAEPPLRVFLVPPAAGEVGGRWKVEATLRAGAGPGNGSFDSWRERLVARSLGTRLRGKEPLGLLLLLHRAGLPDIDLRYDGHGAPIGAARAVQPSPAPPSSAPVPASPR